MRLWRLDRVLTPAGPHQYKAKIKTVAEKLETFSKDKGLPSKLIMNEYAGFFCHIAKETSFNKIYTRSEEFMGRYVLPAADITEEDVEFADTVEETWNNMNTTTSKDIPFALSSILIKSGVKIKENTFFKRNYQFLNFCLIASFVRQNRKTFPLIHGMCEFFLHLPIVWRWPKEYTAFHYTNHKKMSETLEKYYLRIYGRTQQNMRFEKFVEMFKGHDAVGSEKEIWGIRELHNV